MMTLKRKGKRTGKEVDIQPTCGTHHFSAMVATIFMYGCHDVAWHAYVLNYLKTGEPIKMPFGETQVGPGIQ